MGNQNWSKPYDVLMGDELSVSKMETRSQGEAQRLDTNETKAIDNSIKNQSDGKSASNYSEKQNEAPAQNASSEKHVPGMIDLRDNHSSRNVVDDPDSNSNDGNMKSKHKESKTILTQEPIIPVIRAVLDKREDLPATPALVQIEDCAKISHWPLSLPPKPIVAKTNKPINGNAMYNEKQLQHSKPGKYTEIPHLLDAFRMVFAF